MIYLFIVGTDLALISHTAKEPLILFRRTGQADFLPAVEGLSLPLPFLQFIEPVMAALLPGKARIARVCGKQHGQRIAFAHSTNPPHLVAWCSFASHDKHL